MSLNIINAEDIKKYLTEMAADDVVTVWLSATLYKPLLKRKENAVTLKEIPADAPAWLQNKWDITSGPFHKFVPDKTLEDKVRHIKDWLISAKQRGETYSVARLQKLATLENATTAADKYFEELNKKQPKIIEDDADTKTVMTFDDGSRIVQLLTPNTLKYEGPAMGHCIGGGSYDQDLLNGSCVFYSLRDKDNNPHATFHVEVEGNILRQCKGKKNEPPMQKYMPYVQQFVTENKFQLEESAAHTGLVQDDRGRYHSIHNLPENMTIRCDLNLGGCTDLTQLPENLIVGDALYLNDCTGLMHLPRNLTVGGGIGLSGCTSLTGLPKNLARAAGGIDLEGCTGLTTLPDNLSVDVGLNLTGCTALTKLPDNLTVNGILHLDGCKGLTHLPESLTVGTSLSLQSCTGLTHLPENLTVKDMLDLRGCTGLTYLPENLTVSTSLHLKGCTGLTHLPENLTVGSALDLRGCTGLKSIPRTMKCSGKIYTRLGVFDTVAAAVDAFDKKYQLQTAVAQDTATAPHGVAKKIQRLFGKKN